MPDMPELVVVVVDVLGVVVVMPDVVEVDGGGLAMDPLVEPDVVVEVLGVGEPLMPVALPRVPPPALLAPELEAAPPPWSPLPALPVDCAYERPIAPTTNTVAIAEARDLRVFICDS